MDLAKTLAIVVGGMAAQSTRLQVIAENLANAETTGATAGTDLSRRRTVTLAEIFQNGAIGMEEGKIGTDPFPLRFDPSNPAANAQAYVNLPNVNAIVEETDMRPAERSDKVNLHVIQAARAMLSRALALLK